MPNTSLRIGKPACFQDERPSGRAHEPNRCKSGPYPVRAAFVADRWCSSPAKPRRRNADKVLSMTRAMGLGHSVQFQVNRSGQTRGTMAGAMYLQGVTTAESVPSFYRMG
jgi:hypothetical protein